MRRSVLVLVTAAVIAGLPSCVAHRQPPVAQHEEGAVARGYLDLLPGWRIRVVTPVTKSGTLNVAAESVSSSGSELAIKTSPDFIGYEISYYGVEPRYDGGISIRFTSAEISKNGQMTRQSRPLVPLFALPPQMRYARLLFLTRVSSADHDQGVVAAPTMEVLQALTARVLADPERSCTPDPSAFCSWIPLGIAVQPERRGSGHPKQWVPAS